MIQIQYLYPKPDPLTKFYEMRTANISLEFLKKLVNIKDLPYLIRDDERSLFLDGQYTYKQIRKIIKKYADTM